jgi:hypothetical protein
MTELNPREHPLLSSSLDPYLFAFRGIFVTKFRQVYGLMYGTNQKKQVFTGPSPA